MTSKRETEIRVNRRLTRAMIRTNPVAVTLIPHERQENDAGGWKYIQKVERDPQIVKLIESLLIGQTEPQTTIDGIQREVTYELLGMPELIIALFDRFFLDSVEYEVTQILPENGWERKALVVTRG
jgi:hypothetical protein